MRTVATVTVRPIVFWGYFMPDLSEWKPEYSVGNRTLDLQHQRLLALCKRVSSYMCDGTRASVDAFHVILNDLAFYAKKHFETEEMVLAQIGYSKLSDQREEHDAYREKMIEYMFSAMHGSIDKVSLQDYLETWWIKHILVSDMDYSEALKRAAP